MTRPIDPCQKCTHARSLHRDSPALGQEVCDAGGCECSGFAGDGFDLADFFEQMAAQDSDELSFAVTRKPERGATISAEGMDTLKDVFGAFVGARLVASLQRRGKQAPGHAKVGIELSVSIDGETRRVHADLHPWYALTDGESRSHG